MPPYSAPYDFAARLPTADSRPMETVPRTAAGAAGAGAVGAPWAAAAGTASTPATTAAAPLTNPRLPGRVSFMDSPLVCLHRHRGVNGISRELTPTEHEWRTNDASCGRASADEMGNRLVHGVRRVRS